MRIKHQWSAIGIEGRFRILVRCVALFIALHIFSVNGFTQSASVSLDRDKILLGEQVTLQLKLDNVNEDIYFVEAWPQISDSINHSEIVKRSPIDTIAVNGVNVYQQSFTITSFDSGRWQLGPFIFVLQEKATGKKTQLQTTPVYLIVLPVDVSTLKDYHPIKDIIDVETSFNWMPVIIAAIVIVLAVIIFILIKQRKKKPVQAAKPLLKGTPLERALEKLHALQKENLHSAEAIKKVHFEADVAVREYLEEVTQVKAMHLTSSELLSRLKIYMQDMAFRQKFSSVIDLNASVKFAKYMPAEEDSKNTLKEIIEIVKQIDDTINRAKADADRLVPKY